MSSSDTSDWWCIEVSVSYEFQPGWAGTLRAGFQAIAHSSGLRCSDCKAGVTKAMDGGWVPGLADATTVGTDCWKNCPSEHHQGHGCGHRDRVGQLQLLVAVGTCRGAALCRRPA